MRFNRLLELHFLLLISLSTHHLQVSAKNDVYWARHDANNVTKSLRIINGEEVSSSHGQLFSQ